MTYIVIRETGESHPHPGTTAFTGPFRSAALAVRERDAWIEGGRRARVVDYTDAVKADVRRWKRGERWPYTDDAVIA